MTQEEIKQEIERIYDEIGEHFSTFPTLGERKNTRTRKIKKLLSLFAQAQEELLREVDKEVIGEDVDSGSWTFLERDEYQNDLRAEQRIALSHLREGKK